MTNKSINEKTISEIREKLQEGVVPQWVITDPFILKMEVKRIFRRT